MKLPHDRRYYSPFLGIAFVAITLACYVTVVLLWWFN